MAQLVKNPPAMGSIPGLGRSPGEGNGYLFQYSGLENSMDCIVHGVTKNQTRLSDFHFEDIKYKNYFILCATFLGKIIQFYKIIKF